MISIARANVGDVTDAHPVAQRFAAIFVSVALATFSLVAIWLGSVPGPEWKPFLPMIGTAWALADLMTAFLLLAQFYVGGTTVYAVLATAYGVSGLLTWPYVLAFPGIGSAGNGSVADQQISIWIWTIWHATFPALIVISVVWDPQFSHRIVSYTARRRALWATIGATFLIAVASTVAVFAFRHVLPRLVYNGHLEYGFSRAIAPAIVALNVLGCVLLARRFADMTTLQVWIFVAMVAAAMDGILLSWSPNRYSFGWYVGKIETVSTAGVVLAMLLAEVSGLYRRLAEMAVVDPLTRLFNRRAYDDHLQLALRLARRHSTALGLLVIDVDFFKGFNDAYGHARGDECLRELGVLLRAVATRPLDHVSRFGGEEFVIILPDTSPGGLVVVANRLLHAVRGAAIPYAESAVGGVTVSIGASALVDARFATAADFFANADAALFDAKRKGRNRLSVSTYVPQSVRDAPPSLEEVVA